MRRFPVLASPFAALASRPKLALGLVRLLMVTTLVTVLLASLYLQSAFDSLRAGNLSARNTNLAARSIQISLRQALADERLASLAASPAALRDATRRFNDDVRETLDRLAALDVHKTKPNSPLRASAALLRNAVPPALSRLRRLVPGQPGAIASGTDVTILVEPDRLIELVTADTLAAQLATVHRIEHRERLDIAAPLAALTLFVVLLGGSATRLIEGRQRLHAARRAASHQAQLLIGAVEHMRDGVAVFDAQDRLILGNGRLGSVAGLPDVLTAEQTSYGAMAASLAGAEPKLLDGPRPVPGEPVAGEMRVGDRVLAVYRSAMPNGSQMLTISDVTERIAAEELVRRAQRMEALGRLTGGVAHDFNNLLQALTANLEVLSVEVADMCEPRLTGLTTEALNAVERGTRLTRHLLAFARRQELAAVALDTSTIVRALRDLLARTLGDAIDVRLTAEHDLWPVFADAAGLENALLNLALNGRDAMPDGGTLSIDARNHADGDEQWVRIEVADEGAGMTPDQLARAVEPFYTTKTVGAGVGLGLSLVDGFARQSGGRFRLDSELGRGTNAILELPRAPAAPAPSPSPPPLQVGHGETVLLVEDDPVVSRASREALEQLGYEVVEAANAMSACIRLEHDGLRPDLMFTDVMMPGPLDVVDLARRARALIPTLPILFNTGDVEARVLAGIVFDDRMRLIAKPWRLAEVSSQIRFLLDQPELALAKP